MNEPRKIYRVKSTDEFYTIDGRAAFVIKSPVESPRNRQDMLKAIGPKLIIDDIECEPVAFDWYALATPVRIGEPIMVLVEYVE